MAPGEPDDSTSIDFSQNIEVVVRVYGVRVSSATTSPLPSADRYDVTTAPACWLGWTFASCTNRLIARSCQAATFSVTGSLTAVPPGAIVTAGSPLKVTRRFEPFASAAA